MLNHPIKLKRISTRFKNLKDTNRLKILFNTISSVALLDNNIEDINNIKKNKIKKINKKGTPNELDDINW